MPNSTKVTVLHFIQMLPTVTKVSATTFARILNIVNLL